MQEVCSICWVAWEILKVRFVEQNLTWGGAVGGEGHLDILKGWRPRRFPPAVLAKDLYWQGLCYTGECWETPSTRGFPGTFSTSSSHRVMQSLSTLTSFRKPNCQTWVLHWSSLISHPKPGHWRRQNDSPGLSCPHRYLRLCSRRNRVRCIQCCWSRRWGYRLSRGSYTGGYTPRRSVQIQSYDRKKILIHAIEHH